MIKFNKHNVTNGTTKARVSYDLGKLIDGRTCVTIYEKDYATKLFQIFPDAFNNSDLMTDYFEKTKVRIFEGDALYEAAKATVEAIQTARQIKYAKRVAA